MRRVNVIGFNTLLFMFRKNAVEFPGNIFQDRIGDQFPKQLPHFLVLLNESRVRSSIKISEFHIQPG